MCPAPEPRPHVDSRGPRRRTRPRVGGCAPRCLSRSVGSPRHKWPPCPADGSHVRSGRAAMRRAAHGSHAVMRRATHGNRRNSQKREEEIDGREVREDTEKEELASMVRGGDGRGEEEGAERWTVEGATADGGGELRARRGLVEKTREVDDESQGDEIR